MNRQLEAHGIIVKAGAIVDARGDLLGEFTAKEKILIADQTGKIKGVTPQLQRHFENDVIVL